MILDADTGSVNEPDPVVIDFGMMGEVDWCDTANDWSATMQSLFEASVEELHTETRVKPNLAWRSCTRVATGYAYDHDRRGYEHVHDPNADTEEHPWAFNNVDGQHGACNDDPDSYLNAAIVMGTQDRPDVYDPRGVNAWAEHLAGMSSDDTVEQVDIHTLMHWDPIDEGVFGCAVQNGTRSLATSSNPEVALGQETGHNLGADHCDADLDNSTGQNVWTVMASEGDPQCLQEIDEWVIDFSEANADNVDACVSGGSKC